MGREVRLVPADWQHPQSTINGRMQYQPMFDRPFAPAMREWYEAWQAWERGERPQHSEDCANYWDWAGGPPDPEYYRPDWPDSIRTHLMMYEDTSEGTPISPAFKTPEELARWLADNNASAFGGMTATYDEWLSTCRRGWAPCAIFDSTNGLQSGVAASLAA